MSTVMTETPEATPAEEQRGGDEGTDWGLVRPGQPFPVPGKDVPDDRCQLEEEDLDAGAAPLYHWCGLAGCGGD
jgi:hypothetical protein